MLTPQEAKELGGIVTTTAPAPTQPELAERPDGRYRMKGPGRVKHRKRVYKPGAILDLLAHDARSLGAAVELVEAAE